MEYRVFDNSVVLRIQKGEEILETIKTVCEREKIALAEVSGIGAVNDVTLGVFNSEKFEYESLQFTGDMEIASCTGNVSQMKGQTYLHLHMVVGNVTRGIVHAGHLNRAKVSLTGEFTIRRINGSVDREYSPEVGLNLFRF